MFGTGTLPTILFEIGRRGARGFLIVRSKMTTLCLHRTRALPKFHTLRRSHELVIDARLHDQGYLSIKLRTAILRLIHAMLNGGLFDEAAFVRRPKPVLQDQSRSRRN